MIATLPTGPLDILGDVHGEYDALCQVLEVAGYDAAGSHPDGRHLVFLGDLVDRGPDSTAVVRLVQSLVEQGRASAILGNHELNLLRGRRKPGNDWFWGERTHHDERYTPWAYADANDRAELFAFISRLPLALVRDDLRVVHAAWHGPSVETLAGYTFDIDIGQLFDDLGAAVDSDLRASGIIDRAAADKAKWRHHFKGDPDLFAGVAPTAWLGPRARVFCADFSVGGRYQERSVPAAARHTRLAALQWPERTLMLDAGDHVNSSHR